MLAGIYSLLSAALFTALDAVDVAFTEAAVGAGISTILVLGTLSLVGHEQKKSTRSSVIPFLVVLVTGSILVYGTLDMPPYGDPGNPAHHHVAPHYLEEAEHEIGFDYVVTSVLASYRGYDTMGDTAVIFTAMVGVMVMMGGVRRRGTAGKPDASLADGPTAGDASAGRPAGRAEAGGEGEAHGG